MTAWITSGALHFRVPSGFVEMAVESKGQGRILDLEPGLASQLSWTHDQLAHEPRLQLWQPLILEVKVLFDAALGNWSEISCHSFNNCRGRTLSVINLNWERIFFSDNSFSKLRKNWTDSNIWPKMRSFFSGLSALQKEKQVRNELLWNRYPRKSLE